MDLGSFLADNTLGGDSWADDEVDISSIGVQTSSTAAVPERQQQASFSGSQDNSFTDSRPKREEFPIPDHPPFRARIGNLPWDITEEDVSKFFEKRMQMNQVVENVNLPTDQATGRLKGFGFVTFSEREVLEEALNLTLSDFNGRKIFVSVAAPQKQDVFDLDWRSARSGPLGSRGPRREEPDLDWGSARSSLGGLPPREPRERRFKREEPDLDWGSARGSAAGLPPREPRERKPRREEPDLDWGSARSTLGGLPPREPRERRFKKEEPELDWGSARSEKVSLPPRERFNRPKKQEPEFDWGAARSEKVSLPPRSRNTSSRFNKPEQKEEQGPQKSSYDVLRTEDSDDDEEEQKEEPAPVKSEPTLEQQTANLSVSNDNEDGWEVVRK